MAFYSLDNPILESGQISDQSFTWLKMSRASCKHVSNPNNVFLSIFRSSFACHLRALSRALYLIQFEKEPSRCSHFGCGTFDGRFVQLSKRRFREKARLRLLWLLEPFAAERTGPLVAPEPFAHQGQKIEWISVSSNAISEKESDGSNSIDIG